MAEVSARNLGEEFCLWDIFDVWKDLLSTYAFHSSNWFLSAAIISLLLVSLYLVVLSILSSTGRASLPKPLC